MASSLSITSAININLEEFKRVLNQYPALIKRVSDEKGGKWIKRYQGCHFTRVSANQYQPIAKGGQRTLQELDNYRYKDALDAFNFSAKSRPMKLDDIKNLVEWKLWVQVHPPVPESYSCMRSKLKSFANKDQTPWEVQTNSYESGLI
jgi:hypothetical protein